MLAQKKVCLDALLLRSCMLFTKERGIQETDNLILYNKPRYQRSGILGTCPSQFIVSSLSDINSFLIRCSGL